MTARKATGVPALLGKYAGIVMMKANTVTNRTAQVGVLFAPSRRQRLCPGIAPSREKANVIRDGQGRLYRERQHFTPDQNADPRITLYEFYIDDPSARTRTICTVRTRSCHILGYQPTRELPLQPPGPFDQGRRTLTREPLGSQTVDGLPVVGTLENVTVSPGTIGNDTPVTLSREFWYSADLKTNLSVIRKDPREGTQTVTFTTLSRNEPDPRDFAIPSGYTVTDDRRPARPVN